MKKMFNEETVQRRNCSKKKMFSEEKEEAALPEEIDETAKPQRSSLMGRDTAADSEVVV